MLREITPIGAGLVRDCLLIARADRGDQSVRPEICRIVKHAEYPNIRMAGLQACLTIGNTTDLPVLEGVAKSAPFRIELTEQERHLVMLKRSEGVTDIDPDQIYPNRLHARELLRRIESQAGFLK